MAETHAAGWSIRAFRRSDMPRCEDIFLDCLANFAWRGRPSGYVAPMQQALLHSASFVAEEAQAGVVGFLTVDATKGYVDHLFVDEDWRLCGVGRGLLRQARTVCNRPLTLSVDAENTRAYNAYIAMGWEETGLSGGRGANRWIRLRSP